MSNTLSINREFPACGYGLSGLCCSACLLGPCRISPFEREAERGKCGASADWLVAGNLLRMIAAETASRLADLAQIVAQTRASSRTPSARSSEKSKAAQDIFEKYGLDRDAAGKTCGATLLASVIEDLLVLAPPARKVASYLSRLYPVDVFPQFYSREILPTASLSLTGLTAFQLFQKIDAAVQDILQMCLKTSLVFLICEELIQDLEILRGKRLSSEIRRDGSDLAEALNPALHPENAALLIAGDQGGERFDREVETFRQHWRGPLIEVSPPAVLLDIGRQFYRRYSRPVADMAPLVVALTSSAAQIVGILGCGYTVISRPELPLSGSEPVGRFFGKDLKKALGSSYLSPEGGDILSVARNHFRKKS